MIEVGSSVIGIVVMEVRIGVVVGMSEVGIGWMIDGGGCCFGNVVS